MLGMIIHRLDCSTPVQSAQRYLWRARVKEPSRLVADDAVCRGCPRVLRKSAAERACCSEGLPV